LLFIGNGRRIFIEQGDNARNIFMRKRYKNKKASCSLCKPQKKGLSVRWNSKEFYLLKEWERIKQVVEIG